MTLPFHYDWKNPDHAQVFAYRAERLLKIRRAIKAEEDSGTPRNESKTLHGLHSYYCDNPIQFIHDWGCTVDPRNVEVGLPPLMPFMPYPKQDEWFAYALRKWKAREPAATPKSREVGVSWCAVALSDTLCLFNEGMVIGMGSRKEEYVDKKADPKSLFWKARTFLENLPIEFRGGFDARRHAPHMRIMFPLSGSIITGEAGDNIGRGDRTSIYFVDESAFIERPEGLEASLSMTTNNRHDISSYNGTNNPFYRRCTDGKVEVFPFHWRDDPRKDDAWYQKKTDELSPVVVASEIDMNAGASVERIIIPSAWVQSCIDAHVKLNIRPTGSRRGALDVADEGQDKNAFSTCTGVLIDSCQEWSGVGDDIFKTVEKSFTVCDIMGVGGFRYDADGLGAGVRGDARVINEQRALKHHREIIVDAYRGSGEIVNPERPIPTAQPLGVRPDGKERKNEDFFANHKAQAWWGVRVAAQITHRAVIGELLPGQYDPDAILSLSSSMPDLQKLVLELSQPTYDVNSAGKILVDKAPNGARSPNLADSVVILRAPVSVKPATFF